MESCFRLLFPQTKFFIKGIINHFIGNYLTDELCEDQIELIDNYAQCSKIHVNVKVINDIFEKQNIPINLLYGFIGKIKIFLPWKRTDGKLLLEIDELELSFCPALRNAVPDSASTTLAGVLNWLKIAVFVGGLGEGVLISFFHNLCIITDVVIGNMMDSMMSMQCSYQEEDFSSMIFHEKEKGKNFNCLMSKWLSKLCLKFTNTRLHFESRLIPQFNQCCQLLCQIDLISLDSKETDSLNLNSSSLLGIMLKNNIEISGISVSWEVASNSSDSPVASSSMGSTGIASAVLCSSQILAVTGTTCLNYTLVINNPTPELEVSCTVDQLHILLAPMQLHWIQLIVAQCFTHDHDPSLAKNVPMTESQLESYFPSIDQSGHCGHNTQNMESIYYDVKTFNESMSYSQQYAPYDDVPLNNSSDDDDHYADNDGTYNQDGDLHDDNETVDSASQFDFQNDTATYASLASNLTFFNDDGKMNTNFKATLSIKQVGLKLVLQNPVSECDHLDFHQDPQLSKRKARRDWQDFSRKFFGLLKRNEFDCCSFQSLQDFHRDSDKSDYISCFLSGGMFTALTKKCKDKLNKSFLVSCDELHCSETLGKSTSRGLDGDTLQLISIDVMVDDEQSLTGSDTDLRGLTLKLEYNSVKEELSLDLDVQRCWLGCDVSIQDRLRPLLQNDLIKYTTFEKTTSYEFAKTSASSQCSGSGVTTSEDLGVLSVVVVSVARLAVQLHVPVVNLNQDVAHYWQWRMLHPDRLLLETEAAARLILRLPGPPHKTGRGRAAAAPSGDTVLDLTTGTVSVFLVSDNIGKSPIFTIINNQADPVSRSTISVKLKKVCQNIVEEDGSNLQNGEFETLNKYAFVKKQKSSSSKPYTSTEYSGNNSAHKVIYTPADKKTVNQFIENSVRNSSVEININATMILGLILDKGILELLYHRLAFDLVLWESNYDKRNNFIMGFPSGNLASSGPPSLNALPQQFDTDDETNTDTSYDEDLAAVAAAACMSSPSGSVLANGPRSLSHFQPKKFSLTVQSEAVKMYLQTGGSSSSNTSKLTSETVLVLNDFNVFTDSDVVTEPVQMQSILVCTVKHLKVFHSEAAPVDAESLLQRVPQDSYQLLPDVYRCVLDRIPFPLMQHLRPPATVSMEPGCGQESGDDQDGYDNNGGNMLLLVMDTELSRCKKTRYNNLQKSTSIVTARLRESCLHQSYDWRRDVDDAADDSLQWLTVLSELLALSNPVITGYTLPDTETKMHLHLEQSALEFSFSRYPMSILTLMKKIDVEMVLSSTESYCLSCELGFTGCRMYLRRHQQNPQQQQKRSEDSLAELCDAVGGRPLYCLTQLGYIFIVDLGNLDVRLTKIGSTNSGDVAQQHDSDRVGKCDQSWPSTVVNISHCSQTEKPASSTFSLTNTEMGLHMCSDSLQLLLSCFSSVSSTQPQPQKQQRHPQQQASHRRSRNVGPSSEQIVSDAETDTGRVRQQSLTIPLRDEPTKVHFHDMISDAMKDCTLHDQQQQLNKRQSDDSCDGFLLIDENQVLTSADEKVTSLEAGTTGSLCSNRLSVVWDHYKPVRPDEDKYNNIRRQIHARHCSHFQATGGSGSFGSGGSIDDGEIQSDWSSTSLTQGGHRSGGQQTDHARDQQDCGGGSSCGNLSDSQYPVPDNCLILHDFSLAINMYAGSDLDCHLDQHPPSGSFSSVTGSSQSSKGSEAAKKSKIKMSNSFNVKFQRFPTDNKVSAANVEDVDFDAYYGRRKNINKNAGGYNRKLNQAYRLTLSKIYFRYDHYATLAWPGNDLSSFTGCLGSVQAASAIQTQQQLSRRLLFLVNSVELSCHNSASAVNKNLFCDTDVQSWFDPKAPMVNLKVIYYQNNPRHDVVSEECDIKLSIQPIRLNIDQELLIFYEAFSSPFSPVTKDSGQTTVTAGSATAMSVSAKDCIVIPAASSGHRNELALGRGGGIDSIAGSSPLSRASTMRVPAFDELASQQQSAPEPDTAIHETITAPSTVSTDAVFIRSFRLCPDLSIRLDYNGTRLDLTKGAIRGLVFLLAQLNSVILLVKQRRYTDGITGFEALFMLLLKQVGEELCAQLSNIVTRFGPISEIAELLSGIYDFFSLPYHHYRNQESVIEGIKLGTRSITSRSLWAALTLISKGLKLFQKMAETTYELVSPEPEYSPQFASSSGTGDGGTTPPASGRDLREGVTNAAYGVSRRFRHTAHELQVAMNGRRHRPAHRAGVGRIGDLLRQVPPAMASPLVAACEATSQLVDGLRYQVRPELRTEDQKKWKQTHQH